MAKSTEKKMSHMEFVTRAVQTLRRPGYKGIHSVYSGFNSAFRTYYDTDPVQATEALAKAGSIVTHPVKGGAMIYLPGDAPTTGNKALATILGAKK